MSEAENNSEFFAGFLSDYFAECDEHIMAVRRALLVLERAVGQTRLDRALLDELFRRFHSLKGISGMVGVQQAEQLAHQMESFLRNLRQDQIGLNEAGMDALLAGAQLLEQVIAARRNQESFPDIAPVMAQLIEVTSSSNSSNNSNSSNRSNGSTSSPATSTESTATTIIPSQPRLEEAAYERLRAALANGARAWRFIFTPTPALTERGINVNSVRARLQQIGDLLLGAPKVLANGGIAFEFIVVSLSPETSFQSWQADGISYDAYEMLPTKEFAAIAAEAAPIVEDRSSPFVSTLVPSNIVRVDLDRLDELMRIVGELVISRGRLEDHLSRLETMMPAQQWQTLQETNQTMERHLRDLRAGVMNVRMVSIGEIFERMQFVVRDLMRESRKKIRLEISGQATEIDKYLVERMMDPLLHLVRNAVSHGLETEDERVAAGKPPEGRISLRASTAAEMVIIEIEDDGRGINVARIEERARALGLINDETVINDYLLLELICSPGFSTREEIDRVSGRGIGMSVVKNTVQELGGTLLLEMRPGEGTLFTIQLPLTLSIADALIIAVGDQIYAVPQSVVNEVIEVDPNGVTTLENNEIISYRGGVLPIMRLAHLFNLTEQYKRICYALVVGRGLSAFGIVVDRVIGQREIVVRAIADRFVQVAGIGGATDLGNGRVVLILDPGTIATAMRQPVRAELVRADNSPASFQRAQLTSGFSQLELQKQSRFNVNLRRRDAEKRELELRKVEMAENHHETFILFELAGTTYGLRSNVVQQMEMIEEITPVPNAPSFVDGVVFSRGQVIPALNLRARFGFERVPYDIRTRLIVVNSGERTVGFIVDTAREFITIPSGTIQPLNEAIAGLSGEYLQGIARLGERLIMILNLGGVTDLTDTSLPMPKSS